MDLVHLGCFAETLFVLHALVRGETQTEYEFQTGNAKLVAFIAQAEGRERRSLRITEREFAGLYEAVLPETVIDASSLTTWLDGASETELKQLIFSEEQLSTSAAVTVDLQETPESVRLSGVDAPLAYRFSPGEKDDGVTLVVPEALREYLRPRDIDNAVPGFLRERIRLHLKALPKSHRQRLQPMNQTLVRVQQELLDDDHDLEFKERLRACLVGNFGIPPTVCHWDDLEEPAHLRVRVKFLHGSSSNRANEQAATAISERQWVFGHVDPGQAVREKPDDLERFAALSRSGDGVILQTFARADRALREHGNAVTWLAALGASQQLSLLRKAFKASGKDLIGFYDLSWRDAMKEDFTACVLDAAFARATAQSVNTAEGLSEFARAGRAVLIELGQSLLQVLVKIANDYRQAVIAMKSVHSSWPEVAADIEAQLAQLISPGFMRAAGLERLNQFPRYLQAVRVRTERLPKSHQADAKAMAAVRRFERRLTELPATLHTSIEREQFRWLLEEFRVASFAQTLGTAEKVSEQRLEKRWQQLLGIAK
ncbi:MAG: DUF3418 domain-containing protein [Pseudomonadota bacterium]